MMVLVDTPVWSLALRRKQSDLSPREQDLKSALQELVRDGRPKLSALSVRSCSREYGLKKAFAGCATLCGPSTNPSFGSQDYEEAARISNVCRARGIAGSAIDFLICAVAHLRNWEVFTTDRDFARYSKVLPLRLY